MLEKWEKKLLKTEKGSELLVANHPKSVVAEQFRAIQISIQLSMIDKQLKSLVVTSAGREAGKSFVAANLATTFTTEDFQVLLVDGDLRKPSVHRIFSLQNKEGLTTLLGDKSEKLEDTIQKIEIDNLVLNVLTSGPIPPNPAELIASNRMKDLKEEMEGQFDLVIFDTPPILPVTDALVLTNEVDGTVFVIPETLATKDELLKSKELLELAGANVVGAVFNLAEKEPENYYYGREMQ